MITSDQFQGELKELLRYVRVSGARKAVEIGAGNCGTGVCFSHTMGPGSVVVAVDLPESDGGTRSDTEMQAKSMMRDGSEYHLVRGRSGEDDTFVKVRSIVPEADLLFIDGVHTEAAALRDYELYSRLKPKIVAFHDICTKELWPMWNKLRATFAPVQVIEIIDNPSQWGCGIGVIVR